MSLLYQVSIGGSSLGRGGKAGRVGAAWCLLGQPLLLAAIPARLAMVCEVVNVDRDGSGSPVGCWLRNQAAGDTCLASSSRRAAAIIHGSFHLGQRSPGVKVGDWRGWWRAHHLCCGPCESRDSWLECPLSEQPCCPALLGAKTVDVEWLPSLPPSCLPPSFPSILCLSPRPS